MTLYRLINEKKQSAWQVEYERLYLEHLRNKPIDISLDKVSQLTSKDVLWIMHYEDQLRPEIKSCNAFRIAQANGTSANPYCYQVDAKSELEAMREALDAVLVFNPQMKTAMQTHFGDIVDYWDVGFPVTVPKIEQKENRKGVVVAGRISPDKQFFLSTYLLNNFPKMNIPVTFCLPKGEEKWYSLYNPERFDITIKECTREEYLEELSRAEYYFIGSLSDISSVSLCEALLMGCYPLVPKLDELLPTYDSYVDVHYEPFSRASVEKLALDKPECKFSTLWFDPKLCAERLDRRLDEIFG